MEPKLSAPWEEDPIKLVLGMRVSPMMPRKGVCVINQPRSFIGAWGVMGGTVTVAPSLPPATRRAATGAMALERDRREEYHVVLNVE